jgi:glycosyltransferase involved in cell wall biosynthesis
VTLRVVHVASGREWRGGQRQVWLLARELARPGDIEQVVVTGAGSELATRLVHDGIRVHPVPWSAGLDPRGLPGLLAELRPAGSLVHAHDAHAARIAGLAARLARRKLIVTRRVELPLRRLGALARADRVIAISRAVADVLMAGGIPGERITVVHSGIPLDEVRRTPRLGIRERLGLSASTSIAASVGALTAEKDRASLHRAAARLAGRFPSLHWVVAGEGRERPTLEQLGRSLGLEGRVHLLGHLDDPARLIADADVYVSSSLHEGLGTSVLEALALGTPVASTSTGGSREMLHDGAGVLTRPGDPDALADAVARLLTETELRRSVVGQGTEAVEHFTPACMAAGVRSVYRSCVSFP